MPDVHIGKQVRLNRTIVDKHFHLPDGFKAGLDATHDRRRGFHVTTNGVTLIVPEMLGQHSPISMNSPRKSVSMGR
jgi:glucose-1-phosphate adenylyltransferase